jgi:hypothetical protein
MRRSRRRASLWAMPALDRVPRMLVRGEGLALLGGALDLYFHAGYGWLLLLVLALAPDVSLLGFLGGPRLGAAAYNLAHTEVLPLVLGAVGVVAGDDLAVRLALIWLAHIGLDRAIGYGLRYPSALAQTHVQRL